MKKILLWCLSLLTASSLIACGGLKEDEKSENLESQTQSSEVSSEESSEMESTEPESSEEEAETHIYVLQEEVEGTCSTAGTVAHYTCNHCDKLFDLSKNEIASAEGESDASNHSAEELLVAVTQPTKLAYSIGETFDPTGMTVVYKCKNCEGEIIDNQFLTYEYQTENGEAFAAGETKLTVKFNKLSFDLEITVAKTQAAISGLEETYTTSCGIAPIIAATSNVPDCPITIQYFDGETEVTADAFTAGKTYTAKLSIASTDAVDGTEATAAVEVSHSYAWTEDAIDWKKLKYACKCGGTEAFYAMNYQAPYVDEDDLAIDLSKLIVGAEEVSIKSVQKITRMKDGAYVDAKDGVLGDIQSTNEGMVYTFSADEYEKPAGDWKPFILTLSVIYEVNGIECPVVVEAKLVDKLIKEAADLEALAYTGAAQATLGGTMETKYYVLMNDIDASSVVINKSTPAFENLLGFCGVFEGNGHTIENLTVSGGQGLFGAIGEGAKIQNVTFTNVHVASGNYALAFAIRKATLENVQVEFSALSQSYYLSGEANGCTYNNISILTDKTQKLFIKIDGNEEYTLPEALTVNYFTEYVVSFDTDGAGEMDDATVVAGRTLIPPKTPEKTSEEYNYKFLGWYDGETKWDFNTPITSEMTLVAKWEEMEKTTAADVMTAIDALPETVTMPEGINYVPVISSAQAMYSELSETAQASVTNYAKLENLLKKIKGYETVYVPNETGIKAIPCHSPDGNMASTVPATGALSTDAAQGTIFTATSGAGGRVSIQFANFPDVSKYTTIYFYVRSDKAEGYLYISEDTASGGWGTNWVNNYNSIEKNYGKNNVVKGAWSLIAFDTSTGYFTDNWAITVWSTVTDYTLEIGAVVGYNAAAVTEEKTEVTLDWGIRTDSGETNEYGKVYNVSQEQWFVDHNNADTLGSLPTGRLVAAMPSDYEYFVFWMYNGTGTDYNFHLAGSVSESTTPGGWQDSKDTFLLKAGEWTKIVISAEDINYNNEGQWYVYIQGGDGQGATKSGWKISTIYAARIA